jgi:transposase-like protein
VEKASREKVVAFRQNIRELLERRVTAAVEVVLEEELSAALGSGWYERNPVRRGHRNGSARRRITTRGGTRELEVPRGRILGADGSSREFRSELLSRYARRTAEVDEAILTCCQLYA